MILQDTVDFLKQSTPFQFLDEADLRAAARSATLEFFPAGTLILHAGGQPSRFLNVVKKGAVKVFRLGAGGEEIPIDVASEGDMFGYKSMLLGLSGEASPTSARAIEDTLCYRIGRDAVQGLVERNPSLAESLLRSVDHTFMDRAFEELRRRSAASAVDPSAGGWMDRLLYAATVREVASGDFASGPAEMSIREAARRMTEGHKSAIVLTNGEGRPVGIATDTDFRAKVAAGGMDTSRPVREIMSSPVVAVSGPTPCFEALLTMLRKSIHHVLVLDQDGVRPTGILSNRDLTMLQGGSPLVLARRIEDAEDPAGLREASAGMDALIGFLLKEGIGAGHIARIASELSERIVCKGLAMAEKLLGPPPVSYCFIVFGSEGRREQAYRTDQDNAIIYADPASPAQATEAEAYFALFAGLVGDTLASCGYPPCPAGYMAANPAWRLPLRAWKRLFGGWIATPTAESVLRSLIFCDFRPAGGDPALAEELRDHLHASVESGRNFLGFMANQVIKNIPPVGFLRSFVVEKGGEHKDALNLKVKGVAPVVDLIRLFSLEKSIRQTSTIERIHALAENHAIVAEHRDELLSSFEFMLHLRLLNQHDKVEAGGRPDNYINPYSLGSLEKRTLKQAFGLTSRLQDLVIERYRPFIW